MNRVACFQRAILATVVCALASCGTTVRAQEKAAASDSPDASTSAEYPQALRGHWMPADMACTKPVNYDSDVLLVIGRDTFGHYEEANKPVAVQRLSAEPDAWMIKSLLNVGGDGYDIPVSEIFVLAGNDQLAIGSKDDIKTYRRCN